MREIISSKVLHRDIIPSGKSSMQIENKVQPNTNPWGNPKWIGFSLEVWPWKLLFVYNFQANFLIDFLILIDKILISTGGGLGKPVTFREKTWSLQIPLSKVKSIYNLHTSILKIEVYFFICSNSPSWRLLY